MMEFREFFGKDLSEALEKACAYFNTKPEYLAYEILKKTKGGNASRYNSSFEANDVIIKARPRNERVDDDDVVTPSVSASSGFVSEEMVKPYPEITDHSKKILFELEEILKHTGYEFRHSAIENDEELRINIFGPEMKGLIQEEGVGIESIKHILGRIVSKKIEYIKRLNIDINDFRKEKEIYIKKLAHRLSDTAKKSKEEIICNAMNAYDRRIFHLEVEKIDGVSTKSIGDGIFKKIRVIPK